MKRNDTLKGIFGFFKELYARIRDDDVPALGAEFAYHLLLAMFPFLLFLATLATYAPLSTDEALRDLTAVVPGAALDVVEKTLWEISSGKRGNILSLSMLVSIWLASSGFAALARGLNKAYGVAETRGIVRIRALSLLFVPLIAFGILLEAVAVVFGNVLLYEVSEALRFSPALIEFLHALRFTLPLFMLIIIFTLLYSVIPNRRIPLRKALPGAVFASAAWALSSLGFSYYVNRFANYAKTYGSLGGVMILLVWLYLTSVVLLIGCEINAALYLSREPIPAQSKPKRRLPR